MTTVAQRELAVEQVVAWCHRSWANRGGDHVADGLRGATSPDNNHNNHNHNHHDHHDHHETFHSSATAHACFLSRETSHGAAWRRRERQLRAWHRHERMTVAMELATALQGEKHYAPRRPKPPLPGKRPAPLVEVAEPQARLGQHSGIGFELVLALDVLVLQMAEQPVDASALAFLEMAESKRPGGGVHGAGSVQASPSPRPRSSE